MVEHQLVSVSYLAAPALAVNNGMYECHGFMDSEWQNAAPVVCTSLAQCAN